MGSNQAAGCTTNPYCCVTTARILWVALPAIRRVVIRQNMWGGGVLRFIGNQSEQVKRTVPQVRVSEREDE